MGGCADDIYRDTVCHDSKTLIKNSDAYYGNFRDVNNVLVEEFYDF